MLKLTINGIKKYWYILRDSNNKQYEINIEFYDIKQLPKKGDFIYIKDKLMGHRVHEESTTTEIIKDNIRTKEDLEMLKKFWPIPIAKMINHFYKGAEKNNKI